MWIECEIDGLSPLCGAAEAVSVQLVVGALGAQRRGQRQVLARLACAACLLQRAAQAELGEVVDRVALDDRLELARRRLVAAGAEVRAAQGLADRALLGLHRARLLQ